MRITLIIAASIMLIGCGAPPVKHDWRVTDRSTISDRRDGKSTTLFKVTCVDRVTGKGDTDTVGRAIFNVAKVGAACPFDAD